MAEAEPLDDLQRRLRRADLLILRAIRRQRARPSMREKGQFWGTVITDDEVDELLVSHGEIALPPGVDELPEALAATEALRDEQTGPLGALARVHALSPVDRDLLLLALLPDISEGYGRIFAYLNDNLNLPFLTVGLASRVLTTQRRQRLEVQRRLLPDAPLLRRGLLVLHPVHNLDYHASQRVSLERSVFRSLFVSEASGPELEVVREDQVEAPSEQVLPFRGEGLGDLRGDS